MSSNPNYDSLYLVLEKAFRQAAYEKGHVRHATGGKPFEKQVSCWIEREGFDYARGQSVKKIQESLRMEPEAAIQELLGAINYLCAAIIVLQEKGELEKNEA